MSAVVRQRHTLDAAGLTLGRLATRVSTLLRGKQKPTFAPHIDAGDFVHVTNIQLVRFTGRKLVTKQYHRFSGYPSGVRTTTLQTRWGSDPAGVLRDAVFGMLPRTTHRARMIRRLTIK
jgi:large subunit ribosomal protein L13